jgi:predicted transcriptional regulator
MSTTTIRLPEALKARIDAAAERAGQSTHSFIIAAIEEKADYEDGLERPATPADATAAGAVHYYLEERLAGKAPLRLVGKKPVP